MTVHINDPNKFLIQM